MAHMPNLHVRDLPPEALDALRDAARRHRRSLNAEIVEALVGYAERQRQSEHVVERAAALRNRWRELFPAGFPPGLEPETIIRRDRDTR